MQPNQVAQNGSSDSQGPHTGNLVITYTFSIHVQASKPFNSIFMTIGPDKGSLFT